MIPLKKEKGVLAATLGVLSSAVLAPAAQGHDRVSAAAEHHPDALAGTCYPTANGACCANGIASPAIADASAARWRWTTEPTHGQHWTTN